ncbi:MAG TPA: hypothetical protein DIS76_00280 [Rhodospirillaceae bacterium]|nr:hypothetical protein [Rhodospirillaceae bacterium]
MQFIITPSQNSDVQECLDAGMRCFFVDLEIGRTSTGDVTNPPHGFEDCHKIRSCSNAMEIFLRPDGEELRRNPNYLGKVIAAKPDYVFYPNAEDISEVRSLSSTIAASGAKFVAMIETQQGLDALSDILAIDTVGAAYMGLHDFSKSMGCQYVFEPILQGCLDQLASGARQAGKPFGFTSISLALTDEMITSLIKEHARLGSTMTLASVSRLRAIGRPSLQQALTELSKLYRDAKLQDPLAQDMEYRNLVALLNNAQKSAA